MKKFLKVLTVGSVVAWVVKNRKAIGSTIDSIAAQVRIATMKSEVESAVINGTQVYVQDDAVKSVNSIYGVAGKDIFGNNIICVEKALLNAPEYIQHFVVAHELGHIELGHLPEGTPSMAMQLEFAKQAKQRRMLAAKGEVDPKELEADLYAAEKIGFANACTALSHIKQIARVRVGDHPALKEIDKRTIALQEKSIRIVRR